MNMNPQKIKMEDSTMNRENKRKKYEKGPNCLYSLHVDVEPGDRESDCGGHMEPVSVWVKIRANGLLFTDVRCAEH